MRYIIGVDLGGTQLRTALADEAGTLLHEVRVRTAAEAGPEAVIDQIATSVEEIRAFVPEGGELLGIGIGSPGPLDPFTGVVFTQPNMSGWTNVPLRDALAERTGLPVELGNDANAAALGEWLFGAGKGLKHFIYVTVSTGIGGGVIVDGKLLLGRYGAGAEVGHQIIDTTTMKSWENLASGPGLAQAAADAMIEHPESLLNGLATPETVRAVEVAKAAAAGDALAQQLLDREGDLIGLGLVNLLFLYSPELIVLGGGVVIHNPQLLDRARAIIQEHAFEVYRDVPIRSTELGDQVGLLGAVALFLHMHEGQS